MNYCDEVEKIEGLRKITDLLQEWGIIDVVSFISPSLIKTNIFFYRDVSFEEIWKKIRNKCDNKYKLKDYYMSQGDLAIRYEIGDYDYVFFSSEPEEALKKVSGGKCKIISVDDFVTEQLVVCGEEAS